MDCSMCGKTLESMGHFGGLFSTVTSVRGLGSASDYDMWRAQVCTKCKLAFCDDCLELGRPTPCPRCGSPTEPAFRGTVAAMGRVRRWMGRDEAGKLITSGLLEQFVRAKHGVWNHDDWLGFLRRVRAAGYTTIPDDQIGCLLEEEKARFSVQPPVANDANSLGVAQTSAHNEAVAKVPCTRCGTQIMPTTAKRTGGLCMPCATQTGGEASSVRRGSPVSSSERAIARKWWQFWRV